MNQFNKKIFSLKDIKYPWILVISFIHFGISFYIDRIQSNDPIWLIISYWIAFLIAVLWGAINYIGHIRMNAIYKKQDDILAYVNQLAMSKDDKLELQTYLEDYVQDLIRQGKTKEDATREAINQFKVKEFLSLSKNTSIFNLHAHYYLIGWTIVLAITFILICILGLMIESTTLIFLIIEVSLFVYSLGLFGMFFVYKLLDALIYRKLSELFS